MIKHLTKSEFKAKALKYLRQIEVTGESLVITNQGKPVIEIRPVQDEINPLTILKGTVIKYDAPFELVLT